MKRGGCTDTAKRSQILLHPHRSLLRDPSQTLWTNTVVAVVIAAAAVVVAVVVVVVAVATPVFTGTKSIYLLGHENRITIL